MEKEDLILYGYYNEMNEYCVVLNSNKLKFMYKANKIYIDTEE